MAIAEILMDLGIDQTKANVASIPEDRFYNAFNELECLLGGPEKGFDLALDVIDQGDVLNYNGVRLEEYLGLARLVAGRLNYRVEQSEIFYSVESLRSYLDGKKEEGLDFSRINLESCRMLHNNPQSKKYLDSLIESGELEVGHCEHWGGLRGSSICNNLAQQIRHVYDDLGLPRQKVKINHGSRIIMISEETRKLLEQIREYNSQR